MPTATALGQTATINGRSYDSYQIATGVFGWKLSASSATTATTGERTRYLAALPVAATDLNDGEQAVITPGNPLDSMIFENVGGVITYRGQQSIPFRTTVKSTADRNAIAAQHRGPTHRETRMSSDGLGLPPLRIERRR